MVRYIVCKRRNIAAAYERFLGPSAGALPEPWHSRTWSGLVRILKAGPGVGHRLGFPSGVGREDS